MGILWALTGAIGCIGLITHERVCICNTTQLTRYTCENVSSKFVNKTHFKVWRKRLLKLANVYLMHTEQRANMNAVDSLLDFVEFQLPKMHQILTIGILHIIES